MTGLQQTDELHPEGHSPESSLRCQWCSVSLPAGTTVCPTCNSPGVPDPAMTVPGIEILESTPAVEMAKPPGDLDEWWLNDEPASQSGTRQPSSAALVEDRLLKSAAILIGTALFCAFIGWLAGPLLAPAMESITGSPVLDTGDLRPMGTILGFLSGLFLGACIGWISQG